MGFLSYGYKGAVAGGKKVLQKLSGQGKTTGKEGIKSLKPAKNLTTKRNIQDKVVKAVDEGTKKGLAGAKPSQDLKQSASKSKVKESRKLKGLSYKLDKLTEKKATGGRVGKMGGGMMGRRFGYKKGSKKFPDLTGDGKVTFADILKGRGVINGKKKSGKRMQASVGGGADSGRIGQLRSDLRTGKNLTEMKAALKKADKDRNKFDKKFKADLRDRNK